MKWKSLLLCILVITGCGGEPEQSSRIVIGVEAGPDNLDPRIGNSLGAARVHQLLFNRLVLLDDRGLPSGDLAESWDQPDDRTYVFRLRPGVTFHDGRACTSRDVVYTYESLLRGEVISSKKASLEMIEKVEARDDTTVLFTLKEPFSSFLVNLSIGIVPEGAGDRFGDQPVGTGPFSFEYHYPEQEILLRKYPGHFKGDACSEEILIRIIPNAGIRALELEKGSIDAVVNDLNPDDVVRLKDKENLYVLQQMGTTYHYIGFNLNDPVPGNKKVRQAIGHAIDRDKIIRTILQGLAHPATGLLGPANWAYNDAVHGYDFDPEKARRLLDEAGYPDPDGLGPQTRFSLAFKSSTNKLSKQKAEIYKEYLRDIGIDLSIRSYEWATFYNDIKNGDFQMYSLAWTGIEDGDIYRTRFHSGAVPPFGFNRGRYANPEVDRLIEQAKVTLERNALKEIYHQIQAIIAEEAPYISLWYTDNFAVLKKNVTGFRLTPNASFAPFAQTCME